MAVLVSSSRQGFSWQDFAALTRRIAADEAGLRRKFWRKLKREAASIPFLEDVLTAHYCAFDRQTPLYVKAVLVGAMVYFVVPDDLIPDYIPHDRLRRRCRGARRGAQARLLAHQARAPRGGASARWRGCAHKALTVRGTPVRTMAYGCSTILPMTLRSAMALSAAAISASG